MNMFEKGDLVSFKFNDKILKGSVIHIYDDSQLYYKIYVNRGITIRIDKIDLRPYDFDWGKEAENYSNKFFSQTKEKIRLFKEFDKHYDDLILEYDKKLPLLYITDDKEYIMYNGIMYKKEPPIKIGGNKVILKTHLNPIVEYMKKIKGE